MLPHHGPRKLESPFTDVRFNALASCALEGLRVREGRVVATLSALEANDPQEDLVVRTETPRHTSVQQGLNHLGLQRAGLSDYAGPSYISYSFGPNRLTLAHMRRLRRSIAGTWYVVSGII